MSSDWKLHIHLPRYSSGFSSPRHHKLSVTTDLNKLQEDWVLCRVFRKKKKSAVVYSMETEEGSPPLPLPESAIAEEWQQQMMMTQERQEDNGSNTVLNLAVLRGSLVDFPRELGSGRTMVMGVGSRCGGDDYEMMLDMSLQDLDAMGGGIASVGCLRFQGSRDQLLF